MKSIYIFIIVILTGASTITYSQSKWAIKAYHNTDFFTTETNKGDIKHKEFTRLSLAVNIETAKHYIHELELLIPDIDRPSEDLSIPVSCNSYQSDNHKTSVSGYAFRYEINKLLTKSNNKIKCSMGMGINPFMIKFKNEPLNSNTYYTSSKFTGLNFYFVPRVLYAISGKFFTELSLPFNLAEMRYEDRHIDNPHIPIRQQENKVFAYNALPKSYNIRLGFGYRI